MIARNNFLLVGAVATLLSAGAAQAASPIAFSFVGDSGVTGTMEFTFLPAANTGQYYLDVTLTNTTLTNPAPNPPNPTSAVMTGFGFSLPNTMTFLAYSPLNTTPTQTNPEIFTTLFPSLPTTGGSGTQTVTGGTSTTPTDTQIDFDVCAISGSSNNCNGGGSANAGLASADPALSTTPRFTIGGTFIDADAITAAFQSFIDTTEASGSYVAFTRWQSIQPGGGSDKVFGNNCVPGTPGCTPPGGGPGDEVPGPLPLFGAAAAFGYSRKLRRRINATSVVS